MVLLLACCCGLASDLYPNPAWSVGGIASWALPRIASGAALPEIASGAQGHHWSTVACGFGSAAGKGVNAGAKAMAASAIDLLTQPDALQAIRKEFEEYSKRNLPEF
jgi:aminobenzoyl-glutamate utilization protein B